MARLKKARPNASLFVDVLDYKPCLVISLDQHGSLRLHAVVNMEGNWVSHLATTGCLEPLSEVLAASKMLDKIARFTGPIPADASPLLIHYASEVTNLGYDVATEDVIRVTGRLQSFMDDARERLTSNAEEGTHSDSDGDRVYAN